MRGLSGIVAIVAAGALGCSEQPANRERGLLERQMLATLAAFSQVSCLDLPVELCEAHGCEIFWAYPHDAEQGCHQDEAQPAFCRADPEIMCGWQGDPVIMTAPDGTSWYADWSCFTTPESWEREYVQGGEPACTD
ncbi:MAG: hypothetical protein JXR96_20710 [Deltaproteobacteria bacterium]|nr:hypothetical protein [Deltaproteobacteria bacterium]